MLPERIELSTSPLPRARSAVYDGIGRSRKIGFCKTIMHLTVLDSLTESRAVSRNNQPIRYPRLPGRLPAASVGTEVALIQQLRPVLIGIALLRALPRWIESELDVSHVLQASVYCGRVNGPDE